MKISDKGLELIKHFESCELAAYPDPASGLGKACLRLGRKLSEYRTVPDWEGMDGKPWTIGFGATRNVKPGDKMTQAEADARLLEDVAVFEEEVNKAVKVQLTQGEYDAMVSIVYNCGPGAKNKRDGIIRLKTGAPSSLLRQLNLGNKSGAAAQFLRWNRAGGKEMWGLTRRRLSEQHLFLAGEVKTDWQRGDERVVVPVTVTNG